MPRSERYRYITLAIPVHDPLWEHIEAEAASRMKPLKLHVREMLLDRDRQLYGASGQANLWFPHGTILQRLEEIAAHLAHAPHPHITAPQAPNLDENINEHQALANAAAFASAWNEEVEG